MKVENQNFNNVEVLTVSGDMEGEFMNVLFNSTEKAVSAGRAGVVLDMKEVASMDSGALEMLLSIKEFCHNSHSQLRLACPNDNCRKILEITRLEDEFDCFDELSEAVNSFA